MILLQQVKVLQILLLNKQKKALRHLVLVEKDTTENLVITS